MVSTDCEPIQSDGDSSLPEHVDLHRTELEAGDDEEAAVATCLVEVPRLAHRRAHRCVESSRLRLIGEQLSVDVRNRPDSRPVA